MSYEGISSLGKQFGGQPFAVLGFPSNQWGDQEPNSNQWISNFTAGSGRHSCGCPDGRHGKGPLPTTHCDWPGHYCDWVGQAVPPLTLFAKTHIKAPWCTEPRSSCTASSSSCCAPNEAVWQWLAKENSSTYPPVWNWAGKHVLDKCGRLRLSHSGWTPNIASLAPTIEHLLNEKPTCNEKPTI